MASDPVMISPSEWSGLLGTLPASGWPEQITGVQADSRRVRPGEVFVAIDGVAGDGHDFLHEAVKRGAVGVIVEKAPPSALGVPAIQVASSRQALALSSNHVAGYPDRKLHLTGITGTNGKTSVTRFVKHFFEAAGHSTGSLGTVGVSYAGRELPARRTTPSGPELHQVLESVVSAGCTHCVMEVSSHALDQDRVYGLEFDTVVFTNLSQDHLDYHQTMEAYFEVKSRLFAMPGVKCRIVGDDEWSRKLALEYPSDVIRCGVEDACDVRAEPMEMTLTGTVARITSPWGSGELRVPLPGLHNLRNTLQAFAVAAQAGVPVEELLLTAERLHAAPGRLQVIDSKVGKIFVDYAHTPDALGSVLDLVHGLTPGRVVVIFGCGGDRDRVKRPLMVEQACRYADEVIFTLDNPRSEDPDQIFADMEKGVLPGTVHRIDPDRERAIHQAVMGLERGDLLLIAGKGHEAFQEMGSSLIPFDDREVARRAVAAREGAQEEAC